MLSILLFMIIEQWISNMKSMLTVANHAIIIIWDHSGYGLSQWEKALHNNASAYLLNPYNE